MRSRGSRPLPGHGGVGEVKGGGRGGIAAPYAPSLNKKIKIKKIVFKKKRIYKILKRSFIFSNPVHGVLGEVKGGGKGALPAPSPPP